jgi:hypothetical protein
VSAAKKKRITLEMIEQHLKKQDIEFARSLWFALLAFASSIVISGGIFYLSTKDFGVFAYGMMFLIGLLVIYKRWERKLPK